MRVDVEGDAQLVGTLGTAADDLRDLDDVDQVAGELVEYEGRRTAPRDTGALSMSTRVVAGVIESDRPYAVPVHWGWRRGGTVVAARPWLAQTADRQQGRVVDLYLDHTQRELRKVKGK